MNKQFNMKVLISLTFSLISFFGISQVSIYHFDSLNTGLLTGQDGWQTTMSSAATLDVIVKANHSHDGSQAIQYPQSGANKNVSGNRPLNSSFPGFDYSDTSRIYKMYFDAKREYWGTEIGIGYDANNDGKINMASSSTEKGIRFKFGQESNIQTKLYTLDGLVHSGSALPSGGWFQFEIIFDLGANGGQGSISVGYKTLTGIFYTPLFSNISMGLVHSSSTVTNPANWDQFFFHFTGSDSGLDNIELHRSSASPTDIVLSNDSVYENQPIGTFVAQFTSVDPDTADTHTYSLVAGAGDTNNADFYISGDSLFTNTMFDYEQKKSYSIRVRSEDQNNMFFEKAMPIYIKNIEEIGISEYSIEEIDVFPNPSQAVINLNLPDDFRDQDFSFEIIDMGGSIVKNGSQSEKSIDVSDLTMGSYLLKVKSEKGRLFQSKLIID